MLRGSRGVSFGRTSDATVLSFLILSPGPRDLDRHAALDWCTGGENPEEMGSCPVPTGTSLIWLVN